MKLWWMILLGGCAALAQKSEGVISGTVLNFATKLPLENAQVSLIGETSTGTQTDARGAFRFAGLPDGDYLLRVEAPGFSGDEPVKVAAGAEPVTIDLYPMARIEGRILDDDGAPVEGAVVHVRFWQARGANPAMATSGKDGRFLLLNLEPQEYILHVIIPRQMRAAGYPAVEYYPGVTEVERAISVPLAEGVQMAGFDVRLRRVPTVTLRGRVIDLAKNEAAAPVEVAVDSEPSAVADRYERHSLDGQGRFKIDGVPPGRHKLQVFRGSAGEDLPYAATVDVGKEEVVVRVPAFADLHGTVRSTGKAGWEGVLGIGLGTDAAWRRIVVPDKDGNFTLPDVPPGSYTLRLESNNLRAGGKALRIAAAKFGAASVLGSPLTVTESGNPPIDILLSDESGGIAGTVEETEKAAGRILVSAQRLDGMAGTQANFAEAKSDGSFLIPDLLPGEYRVMVWTVAPSRQRVTGVPCADASARVTVANGQTAAVRLKTCGGQ